MTPVLSVRDLKKNYGAMESVRGITFEVKQGEIVGLLGPNGAGKTTTINMILGVLEPTSGTIEIGGHNLATARTDAISITNFAAVYAALPGNLTVRQNLHVFCKLYRVPNPKSRIAEVLRELEIERFADTRCGLLSSGEQTRISLAKAMLNKPSLLLLDEPTASLDPASAQDIRARIRAFAKDRPNGVLWTSHNMLEVQETCDRVLFLSHGKILLEGDPKTLPAEHGKETLEELFVAIAREPLRVEAA